MATRSPWSRQVKVGCADREERRSSTQVVGGSTRRKPCHDQSTFLGQRELHGSEPHHNQPEVVAVPRTDAPERARNPRLHPTPRVQSRLRLIDGSAGLRCGRRKRTPLPKNRNTTIPGSWDRENSTVVNPPLATWGGRCLKNRGIPSEAATRAAYETPIAPVGVRRLCRAALRAPQADAPTAGPLPTGSSLGPPRSPRRR